MKKTKIFVITLLCTALCSASIARPCGGPPPPRRCPPPPPRRCPPPPRCDMWIPATIFSSAFAISAIANATNTRETVYVSTPRETVYVQQPATTTVIYQNPQPTTQTVVEAKKTPVKEEIKADGTRVLYYDTTDATVEVSQKPIREEIKPDGTKILYYK